MKRNILINLGIVLALLLATGVVWALADHYYNLPDRLSQQETIILGQSDLVPGSTAAMRILVRDTRDGSPVEDAGLAISLQPTAGGERMVLFTGRTNALGTADVTFKVPAEAAVDQTLLIQTTSSLGTETVSRPVKLERDYRLLLTTDKPIYQPGQLIRLRVLALSTFDLTPAAGQTVEITIADGKGNKVFRTRLTTDDYGVCYTDFQLASEVNTGNYKISAAMGNTQSEKAVSVEHYVLPKFKVELETEKTFYLPGEVVRGTLKANYFFGKPVAGGQVMIEGYTFDVEQTVVFTLQGATDENGNFEYEFNLPDYIAGSSFENGLGRFYMQASVIDQAQHTEISNTSLPVAASALIIDAIPESGVFRPGVENILYVMTSYPDGRPADASLQVTFYNSGQVMEVDTGEYGVAEIRFTPNDPYQSIHIEASDIMGNVARQDFYWEGEYLPENILLRPEKPVYLTGQTMNLTILTSQASGTVYLDVLREGQIISLRSVEVENGRAEVAVDITPDMFGTLELNAYKVMRDGQIVRDRRLVAVNTTGADLILDIHPGQETYQPGAEGNLEVFVRGMGGEGAQAALGLAVVDESVFALTEQDAGFAKLYFLLESEILTPRYDLHGFSVPEVMTGIPTNQPPLREAINDTAQASLAAAMPRGGGFSLTANSHQDALARANTQRAEFFKGLGGLAAVFIILVPLALLGVTLAAIWRERKIGSSLGIAIAMLLGVFGLFNLLYTLQNPYPQGWFNSTEERFISLFVWLAYEGSNWLTLLLVLGILGLIVLAVYSYLRKDALLGWSLALTLVFEGVFYLLFASAAPARDLASSLTVVLIVLFLAPFAFFIRSANAFFSRNTVQAFASLAVAVSILLVSFPAAAFYRMGGVSSSWDANNKDMNVGMEMVRVPAAMEGGMVVQATEVALMPGMDEKGSGGQAASEGHANEPPRLRQYFPETMLWIPDAITDENGYLNLPFTAADSITIWRITALASTRDGRIGATQGALRVFQDFFIDLDLPLALTVGDEVAVPVGVFNYLPVEQTVRLELEPFDWFTLLDDPVKEMTIASNEISVVYFRVRADQFGYQPFQVTAYGSQMSDAIRKDVRVFPHGKLINFTFADRLIPGQSVMQTALIPADAIAGTQKLLVKIYPGILSQVVEGLDSILRMPYGCFEQTSSTTYPNVLVLDYLKTTGQASPEAQMKAEEYINLGYQRLTTFEVPGGGFSLFGDHPADRMLTAYGLQEFADMSKVYEIDRELIRRAAEWLLGQQTADGSWENDQGLVHENTWSSLGNDRLPVTAYIVWSLIEAGYYDDGRTMNGLAYVREHAGEAEDAYMLALVANALVAADLQAGGITPATTAVLEKLAVLAQSDGDAVYWGSSIATFMGSEGQTGSIETTALAALAFMKSSSHPELSNGALSFLIRQKDSFGTWYSTQATVLSLKALIYSVRAGAENVNATVTISLNGGQTKTLSIDRENFDVVQMISFSDINIGRDNQVEIRTEGEGNLMYQVTGSYYLPWEALPKYTGLIPPTDLVTIDLSYDRTELAVNDTVTVTVRISLNEPGALAKSALIDLGLPPGFTVLTEDLDRLVAYYNDVPEDYEFCQMQRYELTGRQILVYLTNLREGKPLEFSYRLRAKFPLKVSSPATTAYDYYNPDVQGEQPPLVIEVKE